METPDAVPVPGETFGGTLILEVGADGWVEIESIIGSGWSQLGIDDPYGYDLRQGDRVTVSFSGLPSVDYGPIQIEYTFEDRHQSINVDLRHLDPRGNRRPLANQLISVADVLVVDKEESNIWRPDPAPLPQWRLEAEGDPEPQAFDDPVTEKSGRNITIEGRIAYRQPNGVAYGADGMTVRIFDEDNGPDDIMADGVTDQNGYFLFNINWDPCGLCDGAPDIYVEVESQNSVVEVEEAGLLESNYFWESYRLNDFGGSYHDFGTLGPDDATAPAMFISTQVVRVRRMIQDVAGYATPYIDVQWPDGSKGAFYRAYWEEMHVSTAEQWNADTIAHEYGHHWINIYGLRQEPEYCNGLCDDNEPEDDCGHCGWCQETVYTTWSEGWPDWLASFYLRNHLAQYEFEPSNRGNSSFEDQLYCGEYSTPRYDTPGLTEGAFAAFLRDVEDDLNENDPRDPLFSDVMTENPSLIFEAASSQNPDTPTRFISQFRALNPALDEALWETLMNNGFDIDIKSPYPPTNITSANHVVGIASPGARIGLNWTAAVDDFSGIEGYAVTVTSTPGDAPVSPTMGLGTGWLSEPQLPGTYYANIRSFDRAGQRSAVVTLGPFIISQAEPPDLVFVQGTGWDAALVLRSTPDAAPANVPLPNNLLDSGPGGTYWNTRVQNQGEAAAPCCALVRVRADGVNWVDPNDFIPDEDAISGITAGTSHNSLNIGPLDIAPGRHTFSARADANGEIVEQDEFNNQVGRQYVWTPTSLVDGVDDLGWTPPHSTGGFSEVTEGSIGFNALGYRFTASGFWNAVVMWPYRDDVDYDLRLHVRSDDPSGALIAPVAWSSRGRGATDFVLVNRNTMGLGTWDTAVMQGTGTVHEGSFTTRLTTSTNFDYGDSLQIDSDWGEMLVLREVEVAAADTGLVEVIVKCDPAQGPYTVAWFDEAFTRGDAHDSVAEATTDDSGFASLLVNADAVGYYGVVVYRDGDGPHGSAPTSFVLQVGPPLPDLAAYQPGNYELPLVPNEDGGLDYFFEIIPVSTYLPGWDTSAIYSAVKNIGAGVAARPFQDALMVDDVFVGGPLWNINFQAGTSQQTVTDIDGIPGGRHTVWAVFGSGFHEESHTDNNYYAGQWVYAPRELDAGEPLSFEQPTSPTGGWGSFRNPEQVVPPLWFNCHGLRTPMMQPAGSGGNWFVISTLPAGGGDVDFRLHEPSTGSDNGFEGTIGTSYIGGPDQLDYYIVNTGMTGAMEVDVGVVHVSGSAGYTALVAESTLLGTLGSENLTQYGPFSLGPEEIMHLYEVWLEPGLRTIRIEPLDANAKLGLTVSAGIEGAGRGSDLLAESWLEPTGSTEQINVISTQTEPYMVMVWKNLGSEVNANAGYNLIVDQDLVSSVSDNGVPAHTRLALAHPNPFNPSTTIQFDLAQAGTVRLTVFDVSGRKVRTLLAADHLSPGSHQAVWQGDDDSGRSVAAGVYFYRLESGAFAETKRMTLVK